MSLRPFHLAFRVHSLERAEQFYTGKFGAEIGRRSDRW
ncbi:MAG: glyoxalase, partial [Cyanobacteria bacterium P01_A01_bin.135]